MGWLLDRLGWANPSVDPLGWHTLTKRQFSVFLDDIEGRKALGRIHVLHLFLPHHPLAFNEEGKALTSPGSYRQQSLYTDVLVGKIISKLKTEGIYDESVIVLTGDHGQRPLYPSPEMPPANSIPHVPLVIRAPGLDSRVSDVDYQHIDFGPTLRDVLGLPPTDDAEGVSAFSEERPLRDKVFYANPWTYIYSPEDGSWHISQEE
jgi:arylsulfatase A-like enzyme